MAIFASHYDEYQDISSMSGAIGIFGGRFDPVHNGHLRLAIELHERLGLWQTRFIPLHTSPCRRELKATPQQREAMLTMAITENPYMQVDNFEISRQIVSYTIETVRSIRADVGDAPLLLFMGADNFNRLDTWHQWDCILDYVHIVVANRLGVVIRSATIQELTRKHYVDDLVKLKQRPAGNIAELSLPILDISSTQIRQIIAQGKSPQWLLPDRVLEFIEHHQLYLAT